jgi:hypothetical protein
MYVSMASDMMRMCLKTMIYQSGGFKMIQVGKLWYNGQTYNDAGVSVSRV